MHTPAEVTSTKARIVGKVIRSTYFNPENMFTIMRIELDVLPDFLKAEAAGNKDPFDKNVLTEGIAAKGVLRQVQPGERFILEGKWVKDIKWGWQFQFDYFERDIPTTADGLVEYLSSGMFEGIGEKTARKIVDHFGLDTMKILRAQPEKIGEIKGFTPQKTEQFKVDVAKNFIYEEIMLKLRPFGVTPNKVVKIVDKYGSNAVKVVMENPYTLCKDIDGIGFAIADQIAAATGIPENSNFRLEAATMHVIGDSCNSKGHVYVPLDVLQKDIDMELKRTGRPVAKTEIARVVTDLIDSEELIIEEDQAVYLPVMLGMEKRVAKKIRQMIAQPPLKFERPMGQLIKETEKELGITYDENQKEAFTMLDKGRVMVITGGPGTGKSTILKGLLRIIKENFPKFRIAQAAPTGKAARRMMETTGILAQTVHRLLGCRPGKGGQLEPKYDEFEQLPFDVVIVDEESMVDLSVKNMLLKAIPDSCMLIMLGDVDQLPSVGPGAILQDMIESGVIPVTRLTKIFRQANTSPIVVNAASIRDGQFKGLTWNHEFFFEQCHDLADTADAVVEMYKRFLVEGLTFDQIQVLTPLKDKTETGAKELNRRLQQELNPREEGKGEMVIGERIFRVGDPVMQIKNNYEREIFNGSTGIIVEASKSSVSVKFDELDDPVNFDRDDVGELVLNYCTTIHKSQGSEYHTVIVVMNKAHYIMLRRRLLYTAVTRAKKRVMMAGEPDAMRISVVTVKSDGRYTKLKERLAAG